MNTDHAWDLKIFITSQIFVDLIDLFIGFTKFYVENIISILELASNQYY